MTEMHRLHMRQHQPTTQSTDRNNTRANTASTRHKGRNCYVVITIRTCRPRQRVWSRGCAGNPAPAPSIATRNHTPGSHPPQWRRLCAGQSPPCTAQPGPPRQTSVPTYVDKWSENALAFNLKRNELKNKESSKAAITLINQLSARFFRRINLSNINFNPLTLERRKKKSWQIFACRGPRKVLRLANQPERPTWRHSPASDSVSEILHMPPATRARRTFSPRIKLSSLKND